MTASRSRRLGLAPFGLRDDRVPETGYNRPLETIAAAARAGLDAVGIFVVSGPGGAPTPITTDSVLRREARSRLDSGGIEAIYIECLYLEPDTVVARVEPALAAGADLGSRELLCIGRDPDHGRISDRLAALAELGEPYGIRVNLEFFLNSTVPSLAAALAVVAATKRREVGVVVDTLHLARSGGTATELAAVDPARLHFAHLCDGVMPAPPLEALGLDARDRRYPGEGGLPLTEYLAAFPADVPLLLECPIVGESALDLGERARRAVAAARRLLG